MSISPDLAERSDEGLVVHLVGHLSEAMFSFIGPATETLAAAGLAQCVVMTDDPQGVPLMARLHRGVEVVAAPYSRDPLRRHSDLSAAFRAVLQRGGLRAIHLHGFHALWSGRRIARQLARDVPLYFSPHALRGIGPLALLGALPARLVRATLALKGERTIVNMLEEAYTLHRLTQAPMQVIESAVPAVYFDTPLAESRHPLIVTGSNRDDRRSVELFAQLAVLLSGSDLRLSFNWIGRLGAASVARLKAANVGYFEMAEDAEIAARLAPGWVFLAPGDSPGFPVFLANAMAMGLPCVVMGSPEHSDLLRDGETGYLCESDSEVMQRIGRLLDEPWQRRLLGQAARREAQSRFSPQRFRDSLLAAYELDEPPPPEPTRPAGAALHNVATLPGG